MIHYLEKCTVPFYRVTVLFHNISYLRNLSLSATTIPTPGKPSKICLITLLNVYTFIDDIVTVFHGPDLRSLKQFTGPLTYRTIG